MPSYRGKGIGKQLLSTIEKHARDIGCCKLTLEVKVDRRFHVFRIAASTIVMFNHDFSFNFYLASFFILYFLFFILYSFSLFFILYSSLFNFFRFFTNHSTSPLLSPGVRKQRGGQGMLQILWIRTLSATRGDGQRLLLEERTVRGGSSYDTT